MFVLFLVVASVVVMLVSDEWIKPARMVGGGVRRWSGFTMIAVGVWFLLIALVPSPIII